MTKFSNTGLSVITKLDRILSLSKIKHLQIKFEFFINEELFLEQIQMYLFEKYYVLSKMGTHMHKHQIIFVKIRHF